MAWPPRTQEYFPTLFGLISITPTAPAGLPRGLLQRGAAAPPDPQTARISMASAGEVLLYGLKSSGYPPLRLFSPQRGI